MADYFCNYDVDGECNGCNSCGEEQERDVTWEQEWEDFGEVGSETIEYI